MEITVRASSLSAYGDCARRAATKIFRKQIEDAGYELRETPQNVGAAIGTGTHASMGYTLSSKMSDGTLGSESEANDMAIIALHEEAKKGIVFDTVTTNLSAAEKQVVRKSKMFRLAVAPNIAPVAVEVRLFAKVNDTFLLSGQMDYREIKRLGDVKTGKFKGWNAPQYGGYSMLAKSNGIDIEGIDEHFMKTVALDKPEGLPETVKYDIAQAENHATAMLDDMYADFQKFMATGNRFSFRSNASSRMCDPKFCGAFGTNFCREHHNKG